MSELTALEKKLLVKLANELSICDDEIKCIKVSSRTFSTLDNVNCSGFYLHLISNDFFKNVENNKTVYTLQAKENSLKYKEMGFNVLCNLQNSSLEMIEGYTYGDDLVKIEKLVNESQDFFVFATDGL